ncbi:SBBP repeat-containing protein [Flavobacterium sp.]|uniref:SBBP repeat-containing protein n=1 Tax=Flavobacterium sp. TaxID=239 RepID=UPI00286D7B00|nr:SBBP repeat-containing protein [Flavobacterium sp.]
MKKIVLLLALFIGFIANAQTTFEWAKSIGGQNYDDANSIVLDAQGNVYVTGTIEKSFTNSQIDFDPGPGVYNINTPADLFGSIVGINGAFVLKLNAAGEFQWAKYFAGFNTKGNAIAVDSSGNVYTTGSFSYQCDFDPSPNSDFILNSTGQFGTEATDAYISKLDTDGNFVWAKKIGALDIDAGAAITSDAVGNIYVTGKFAGIVNFNTNGGTNLLGAKDPITGNNLNSGFILKLNNNGDYIWAKNIVIDFNQDINAVTVDNAGNVLVIGKFSSITDLDPGTPIFNVTGNGIYILKLDSNGNFIFAKGFVGNVNCNAIKVDSSGNIFTTGSFASVTDFDPSTATFNLTPIYGNADVFIAKLDNLGNFVWAKKIHSTSRDNSRSLALDNQGSLYIAANIENPNFKIDNSPTIVASTTNFKNMVILKFDATGVLLAKNVLGSGSTLEALGLVIDSNYYVHTCGSYQNTTDFNPDTPVFNLTSKGSLDTFISKMKLKNETLTINENNLLKNIKLFPNPTSSKINLNFDNNLEKAILKIISILGQTVLEKQNISGNNLSLDVSSLSNGTYVVQLQEGSSISTSKFIKE